ncbi:MAG: hypothetical protein KC731_19505 [Myxococcales bacterium]|nr:hypothetical protein [Myxococcales bacterium]
MFKRNNLRALALSATAAALLTGCVQDGSTTDESVGVAQDEVVSVAHTPVERQSIGNCWLYAQATWVESMNLSAIQAGATTTGSTDTCSHNVCEEGEKLEASCSSCATSICEADPYCCNNEWDQICQRAVTEVCGATACEDNAEPTEMAEPLDVSQSYWTYWHWFEQVTGYMYGSEISTGGNQWKSNAIVRDRGLMHEGDFVPEDSQSEMSNRQSSALNKINAALKNGELSTQEARRNGELVRQVFDDAWGLSEEVRAELTAAFGADGEMTLRSGGKVEGTHIVDPSTLPVRYTQRQGEETVVKETNLVEAIGDWEVVRYPSSASARRQFLRRVQMALHDQQPVVITWDVDFNAMENGNNERRGSFNKTTLDLAGKPGHQGGHMTVLGDYAAITQEFGLLEAGKTLDPNNAEDAAKLEAALRDDTEILLLRTKNSWGGARPDRAFAPGFPGYHDLYMDYLNGPMKFCPDEEHPTNDNCHGTTVPLSDVMIPKGY